MSPLSALSADSLAVVALLALLVTAYQHPRRSVEVAVSVAAVGAVSASGLLTQGELRATLEGLAPVVAFLAGILVVAQVCARAGLFQALSQRFSGRPGSGPRPQRLLLGALLTAAAVTSVLSLDATVVLLTPVVVAAASAAGTSPRPVSYACLRMANSASVLLPVSNLTNLLALPYLSLSFAGFAVTMAPVLAAVLLVEYVVLRVVLRADLVAPSGPSAPVPSAVPVRVSPFPVVVLCLMLVGFPVASSFGADPWWVSAAAALVLAAWARRRGLMGARAAIHAAHLEFAVFVLALGVVVAAISGGFLGEAVSHLVPESTSLGALSVIALLATMLAGVLTNLSATLLLVPLVAPLGDVAVLAALLGLNIGSGLTYTGSLANLLWRRGFPPGERPSLREFHRVSLLLTPLSLGAALLVLAAVA